jgi:hypothetical protein
MEHPMMAPIMKNLNLMWIVILHLVWCCDMLLLNLVKIGEHRPQGIDGEY